MTKPLWINNVQVEGLLDHASAYEAVKEALLCHAKGDFVQPLKPYVRPRGREGEYSGGRYIAMPAFLGGNFSVPGVKWIASVPANVSRDKPRASGLVILNSQETGEVTAIMECACLSARRTAAVAAISFDLLAPQRELRVGVLGAGPIGTEMIDALATRNRSIVGYQIYDPRTDRAQALAFRIQRANRSSISVVGSAEAAVRGADVVLCATTGTSGYIQHDWLLEGVLIVCMSLDDPSETTFLSSKVVTDDWEQACREEKLLHRLTKAGKFSRDQLHAQLGEILVGKLPGRTTETETFLCSPMGMSIEDLAVARVVFDRAVQLGIGKFLD